VSELVEHLFGSVVVLVSGWEFVSESANREENFPEKDG
jgi:hypothetical protein